MIEFKRIFSTHDDLFAFSWQLYQDAFPAKERRTQDYHTQTLERGEFHSEVVLDEGEAIGILFWWDLSDFRFVEHLATLSQVRGKGYGAKILKRFIAQSNTPVLLEVEHPEDELTSRRIGFYERAGFVLNPHPYRHPSYQQQPNTYVSLMIMTHPKAITAAQLARFTTNYFPLIHFRSY